ncbi:hypothetical protein [Hydrogenophaga luteola]|uniref:DUF4382 domain-containing protein n=1 Tax=Hydrogenophaga luteola TaxID=1591122 RepID=A0ABV7W4G1_9BURK
MAHLPHSIELHDSTLASVLVKENTAIVQLRPAYIHRSGKGWTQDADILIGDAQVDLAGAELPADLANGRVESEGGPYHNLLELPMKAPGPVSLTLELMFSEQVIRVSGNGAEVVLRGEPTYVEEVSL